MAITPENTVALPVKVDSLEEKFAKAKQRYQKQPDPFGLSEISVNTKRECNTRNKMEENNQDDRPNYSKNLQSVWSWLSTEFRRAARLGKRLLGAGRLSEQRSDLYREIGKWVVEQTQAGKLQVPGNYLTDRLLELQELESKLQHIDQEIQAIKLKS